MGKKVPDSEIKQLLNLNLGFRPALNSTFKSASTVGDPQITTGAKKFPAWYGKGGEGVKDQRELIPGLGFVWDKFPYSDMKPNNPIRPNLKGAYWENWYYYLREGLFSGEVDKLEPYQGERLAYLEEPTEEELRMDEQSKRLGGVWPSPLEGKEKIVHSVLRAKGGGFENLPTGRSEFGKDKKQYLKGDKDWGQFGGDDRAIKIESGGHWLQYPKGVGTSGWLEAGGPRVTFDTMRRNADGPIQEILDYFLSKVEGATKAMKKNREVVENTPEGASFDEKLVSLLKKDGERIGFVPEDKAVEGGYNPGHRIDIRFNNEVNLGGSRLSYKMADITSSYFHEGRHHGVGFEEGRKRSSYIRKDKAGNPLVDISKLEAHWNTRIKKFNDILNLLYGVVGSSGTLAEKRKRVVQAAEASGVGGGKTVSNVTNFIRSLDSDILETAAKDATKTVEWVLHHMGDAVVGDTYANIMPIAMNHSDGTLIVIFKVRKNGTYEPINKSGSELQVLDHGFSQALLQLAGQSGDNELQRRTLQMAARAHSTSGYRGLRGGQVIMNTLNVLATKQYRVGYGVPIEDDIKNVIYAKFIELTREVVPNKEDKGQAKKLKQDITNFIKNKANSYSKTLRSDVMNRLGYDKAAVHAWLSGQPERKMFKPLPKLDNLWAQPYFTVSKLMRPPGETAVSPRGFLREVEEDKYEWVLWYKKDHAKEN